MTRADNRTADPSILRLLVDRWSPRAFTEETISEEELKAILEAGRWAPSQYNSQPWRFMYARRDTPHWGHLLSLLKPVNQRWAKSAAALVYVASCKTMIPRTTPDPVFSRTHSYDAGAAAMLVLLQATYAGWSAHTMSGVSNVDETHASLGLPASYAFETVIAIGRQGSPDLLPEDLAVREVPSTRRPLDEIMFEGPFPAS
ncbi:nitroreductase [Gluconacetobacter johannae DSM 13595]|uniref:Nitroreductase family protein n=1 Tax=Gluconacetobacter johannae TaxID=112140 RepID=A0A7W4J5R9_9PROT|nr:nitroreductase family protein [Gluconacetobacter johannae]MBB2175192.1 nitroreductase family protein [Gluconacetobacter johannae]GBQ80577.1 nitroreductase [Gluconacetobacter johannae DSM 13595]